LTAARDRKLRARFARKAGECRQLHSEPNGAVNRPVVFEAWSFPIPLAQKGSSWRLDTEAGFEEAVNRMIASPADYGKTGVMSFPVNRHGAVSQKNLGPNTGRIARGMAE
jgi:hypothetical protein